MLKRIGIIKLGAMGDVLRTTTLLHILKGDVYWITKKECIPLLPANSHLLRQAIAIGDAEEALRETNFDVVISLDDDFEAARLASSLNTKELIGSFADPSGRITYTDSAAEWFDMGLLSKLGKRRADELKIKNKKTYQEIIFNMLGKEFNGEEYILNHEFTAKDESDFPIDALIGIESRTDKRWPTKKWNKYEELGEVLCADGFSMKFFTQRETLEEYINDIAQCGLVITGDTLAMHIALALKKRVIAIFTCTSPEEIYDYGRMLKIVSPLLSKAFYSREYVEEVVDAVSVDSLRKAAMILAGRDNRIKCLM